MSRQVGVQVSRLFEPTGVSNELDAIRSEAEPEQFAGHGKAPRGYERFEHPRAGRCGELQTTTTDTLFLPPLARRRVRLSPAASGQLSSPTAITTECRDGWLANVIVTDLLDTSARFTGQWRTRTEIRTVQ
jgi:hypothetical protein